jgi:hypothetical protein
MADTRKHTMAEPDMYRPASGSLGSDEGPRTTIGGTYHVSTKIDSDRAVLGVYTPINGDTKPAGPDVEGQPTNEPYFPQN